MDDETEVVVIVETAGLYEVTDEVMAYLASAPIEFAPEPAHG